MADFETIDEEFLRKRAALKWGPWGDDVRTSPWHVTFVARIGRGVGSDHRGYNMKSAELFRNGQSKPEVLKESKE